MLFVPFRFLQSFLEVLPRAYRLRLPFVVMLLAGGSVMEAVGVASVIPLLGTLLTDADPRLREYLADLGMDHHALPFLASLFLLIVFALKNIMSIAMTRYQLRFVYSVSAALSKEMFEAYFSGSYLDAAAKARSVGVRDVLYAPIDYAVYVLMNGMIIVSESLILVAILVVLLLFRPATTAVLVTLILPVAWAVYALRRRRLTSISSKIQSDVPGSLEAIYDGTKAYVDAVLYERSWFFVDRFSLRQAELNALYAEAGWLQAIPSRMFEVLGLATIAGLALWAWSEGVASSYWATTLGLYTVASYRILPGIVRTLNALFSLRSRAYSVELIHGRLKAHRGVQSFSGPLPRFDTSIRLENVTFSYPHMPKPLIEELTMKLFRGELVGLYGDSASGKTTLLYLLSGLLSPAAGRVLIDDTLLDNNTRRWWFREVSIVPQEPVIIDASLINNISLGRSLRSDRLWAEEAALSVGLGDLIHSHPLRMDQDVTSSQLSGGQKQRVALARALFFKRNLLLLDECTGQLDEESEGHILDVLEGINRNGVTIVLVSHRLSTFRKCHRVFHLQAARIAATLTYAELTGFAAGRR